ncbi:ABC transporter ATP-binding protein [Roseibium sp. Sym1]|uniref:ABC transporter ATP-binding protein n=1 Tax=Roseibium sp. Sym1 TaxID=3016006 RepID=UPI0022B357E8|nr:sn-glycerol-3-phosphate ABC transporter ATP-binding protein UgpC [Roseibium sp. Sym1]
MAEVSLKNIRKSFGAVDVIKGVDLDIEQGEFVVFVGPSGCGKSTMLRMISGLEDVTSGAIHIAGRDVTHVAPSKRQLAMVFQSYALFPHLTVAENIGFGLKLNKVARAEIDERVRNVAKTLQLETLLDRTPRQLSGGQRQRVAIGRSIIRNPKVFLFDEPLSNLDAALRVQMRLEIARLHKSLDKVTMIYVTHDQVEAMTLADRIVVFNGGRIEQVGTPMELYHNPANTFVAGFIGAPAMNFIDGTVSDDGRVLVGDVDLTASEPTSNRGPVTVGIRPEHMKLVGPGNADFSARVDLVEKLGAETLLYLDTPFSGKPLTARVDGATPVRVGENIHLMVNRTAVHTFAS